MNEEKRKALDAVLTQIEKAYGKGAIMKLGDEAGKIGRASCRERV